GVMLYRLLSGALPFASPSLVELLHRICREEPAPLGQVQPGLPAVLVSVVHDCLGKQASQRPTAGDLAERLERAQSALLATGTWESPVSQHIPPGPSSRRRRLGLTAATGTIALAALAWAVWPSPKQEQRP